MAETSSPVFAGLFIRPYCRNFLVNKLGASARMNAYASVPKACAQALNHLLGQCPRIMFSQNQVAGTMDPSADSANPFYVWKYYDGVDNGISRTVHMLVAPRQNGTGNCYAGTADADGNEYATTGTMNATVASVVFPQDLVYVKMEVDARPESGAPPGSATVSDALVVDGIRTYNGFTIVDVCVQDDAVATLTKGIHTFATTNAATTGGQILANTAEDCRAKYAEVRGTNLGIVGQWAATLVGGVYDTPATPGNQTGLAWEVDTDGNAYRNVFNHAIDARTATSIGISCHAQYAGTGTGAKTAGSKVAVRCAVLAAVTAGATNAKIKFIGPDHILSNELELAVTATTPTWVGGGASDVIYLNSNSADDDATTARNKVDIMAKADTATKKLFVWGIRCWVAS